MGRGKRALAAVAILAALAAASNAATPRAAAEGGELAGDLPVAGGFALVSWSGGPAEALAGAARSRGCNVRSVYANAPGDGLVGYVPAAQVAAANRAFLAAYPDGLPASPVFVVCGEPAPPRLVFLGDVSEERRAAIREEVADVVRFYAERFGVAVGESTLYVSPDGDATAAVYRELTGREYPLFTGHGGAVTDTPEAGILAFVSGHFVNSDSDEFRHVMAHEYYHAIQRDILRSGGGSYSSPQWLTEGSATYGEGLHRARSNTKARLSWALASLNEPASFRDVAESFGIQHYEVAASAIDWLVEASGNPRSHLQYWRALTGEKDWRSAFTAAFGITADEFFDAFEEYRMELVRSLPSIRGMVVDLDGTPLAGVHVTASAPGNDGPGAYGVTNESGMFRIQVGEGEWLISLGRVVSAHPGAPYRSIYYDFRHNPETEYANSCGVLNFITVAGDGVSGIVVSIRPDLLTRIESPVCNEGRPGYRMLRGAVLAPDGTLLNAEWENNWRAFRYMSEQIDLCFETDAGSVRCVDSWGAQGDAFAIAVLDGGSYRLRVGGAGVIRGWHGDGGFTTSSERATVFVVNGADSTGIEVRLPVGFLDLPPVNR